MAYYVNGTLISGANTLPKMTMAEYLALPSDQRPTYWECTDKDYDDISAENVTYEEGVSVKDALDEVNVIKEVGNFKTNGTYTWSSSITNSKIFLVSLVLNNQIRQTVLMCSRQELFKTNGVFPDFMTSDGRVYCQITANDSGYTVSQLSGLSNVGASAALSIQAT